MVSRTRVVMLCALACLCAGCQRVAKGTPVARDTFHVTSVTADATPDVTGTLNGNEYTLSVDRKNVPLYVAYYEPIDVGDVGKEFPARFEEGSNELVIQVPSKGAVHYSIRSVHEKN